MRKAIFIASLCSFLLFMFLSYQITLRMGERDKRITEMEDETVMQQKNLIRDDTKIVYQYFYIRDRVTKESSEMAPDFLQGLDKEQLESVYDGWQIVLFSPETVILRCSLDGLSSETYILGEQDGFLAVFYEDAQKVIRMKEMTEVPLSALAEEDARKIREGVRVTGEENLAKMLADLTS